MKAGGHRAASLIGGRREEQYRCGRSGARRRRTRSTSLAQAIKNMVRTHDGQIVDIVRAAERGGAAAAEARNSLPARHCPDCGTTPHAPTCPAVAVRSNE